MQWWNLNTFNISRVIWTDFGTSKLSITLVISFYEMIMLKLASISVFVFRLKTFNYPKQDNPLNKNST